MNGISAELLKMAKAAGSAAELAALAKKNGVKLTAEEAGRYFARLHSSGELPDEELDNVAGGGCSNKEPKACPQCGAPLRQTSTGSGGFTMQFFNVCDNCGYQEKQ